MIDHCHLRTNLDKCQFVLAVQILLNTLVIFVVQLVEW